MKVPRSFSQDERGVALLIAMIVSVMLVLLGLSVTFSSLTDLTISTELENKRKAFLVASAGFNSMKSALLEKAINEELSATTSVSNYITYPTYTGVAKEYFDRNPLWPKEAMNINFDDPPTPLGTRNVKGLLTPAGGSTLPTGGRYWAKLSDNDDGDGDFDTDSDGRFYLRVLGITQVPPGQVSSYGGNVKNSVAIIEVTLKLDKSLDFSSPFTSAAQDVYHDQAGEQFPNNAFHFDGFDHPGMSLSNLQNLGISPPSQAAHHNPFHDTGSDTSAIQAIFDDATGCGDASSSSSTIHSYLTGPPDRSPNVVGPEGDYGPTGPSIKDGTDDIRNDPDPDAQQIFDPNYVMNFINGAKGNADFVFADGANVSQDLGTDAAPKITYCEGDCRLQGNRSGAGLWIVQGRLEISGNIDYHGLVVVAGDATAHSNAGTLRTSGSMRVLGGIFIARYNWNSSTQSYKYPYDPTCNLSGGDKVRWTITGNSELYFQGSGLALGYSLLGAKLESWREIVPEIEPWF